MCERERVGYDDHDLDCCLDEMDGNERMRMRDGGGGSPAPQRCGGLLRQQTDLPGGSGSGSGSGSVWQLGAGIG